MPYFNEIRTNFSAIELGTFFAAEKNTLSKFFTIDLSEKSILLDDSMKQIKQQYFK